jgi:cell division protein FtsB
MFDKDVGVNWHLRFRLKIEQLEKDNEQLKLKNKILTRKIKKYEDNNTRTTRNREDNNTVKSSRSVYTGRR